MIRFFVISIIFFSNILYANTCKLPKGEVLTIGCTTECKYFYKRAIKKVARKLGYKVKVINLYNKKHEIDFNQVDGILIPGGADINPKYYSPFVEKEYQDELKRLDYLVNYSAEGDKRDPFEYKLLYNYFKLPFENKLPLLGICRGMQLMAVSQRVPLYVDIKAQLGIRNRRYIFDRIRVTDKSSKLYSILKFSKFWGFKQHHQGINVPYFKNNKNRWPHLKITSYSNKGKIAESLEVLNKEAFGVQFHPEIDFGKERRRIFSWILRKSCENKLSKPKLMN